MLSLSEPTRKRIIQDVKNLNLRRRTEDIEYWRKRAGWFDDDVSMKEFNSGVYDTYYQLDDDGVHRSSGGRSVFAGNGKGLSTFLKIGAGIVAIILAVLLFRSLSRRGSSSRTKTSSSKSVSDKSRARSRSRSSRSRSRSRRASTTGANYDLMDDKSEARSKRSSRSRSRSRRHSKSRKSRSRSKSRKADAAQVLV